MRALVSENDVGKGEEFQVSFIAIHVQAEMIISTLSVTCDCRSIRRTFQKMSNNGFLSSTKIPSAAGAFEFIAREVFKSEIGRFCLNEIDID